MTISNSRRSELREQGFRLTPQRLAILDILEHKDGHLTPSEISTLAAQRLPGITETTVYRALEFLTDNGLAQVAYIGDGKLVYESAARKHHHLICRSCGSTVEIGPDLLDILYTKFKEETGYSIDCSHKTFFGYCPECSKSHLANAGSKSR
jgi:Fe2+ or Zn2+ uptake regulation protein